MRAKHLAWLPFLAGCAGAPTEALEVATPEAPVIERIAPAPAPRPVGEGDRVAERCFFQASQAGTPDSAGDGCTDTAPAACAAHCRAGELDACQRLGTWFATDRSCAAKIWELACDRQSAEACTALGRMELETGEDASERSRGAHRLEQACQSGDGPACTALGSWRMRQQEESGSEPYADLLDRACELRDPEGCALAGRAAVNGSDPARAEDLLGRSCELGWLPGCLELATYYLYGRGVTQDEARAKQLLEHVCRQDEPAPAAEACYLLAQIEGLGTIDTPRTQALYGRACQLGQSEACSYVVLGHYEQGRYDEVIALAQKLIEAEPDAWLPRYTRALALLDLGRYADAADDLEHICDLRAGDWPHCHLMLFAARGRAGKDGKDTLAASFVAQLDETTWPAPVAAFYLGKLSAKQLLQKAENADAQKQTEQLCEAYYYIGQQLMIAGKKKQAREMFDKSVATGIESFIEYKGAQAELARLTSAPPKKP
jgi:lipoprotein NlpI